MKNLATMPEYNEDLELELLEAIQAKEEIKATMRIEESKGNREASWLLKHL